MNRKQNLEVFAKTPVRKAVLLQIVPAVASQMVTLVYNLADTYFVGMLNAPHETAAVTVAYPSFLMLTAISNLFGVGGASAIARALGRQDEEGARRIAAVSLAGGLLSALLFSAAFRLLADPVLHLCGATEATYATAYGYAKWVVILGGPFTILNTLLANLVRAEGGAGAAAFGVSFGGVLNILLDPLFVLPQFLGLGAVGAGMATALSNGAAVACFAVYLVRRRGATYLNLLPANLRYAAQYLRPILAIGFPSALQYALTVVATAAQADFVSQYPTEAVAALGIVKKLDQLPLYFSIGVSNGLLPLLAYNHAAGNHHRRAQAFRIGSLMSFGFAVLCLVCYEAFATPPGLPVHCRCCDSPLWGRVPAVHGDGNAHDGPVLSHDHPVPGHGQGQGVPGLLDPAQGCTGHSAALSHGRALSPVRLYVGAAHRGRHLADRSPVVLPGHPKGERGGRNGPSRGLKPA